MWRRVHGMWRYVVLAVWYGQKWWCDVECGVPLGMSGMAFDVEWCNVKCGGNDVTRCEMQWQCVISHIWMFHIEPHVEYVRCYMWCHAMSDEALWNVVMRCGMMVSYMWNMVVCWDARCEMWLCDVEWWCRTCGTWWCAAMQDVVVEFRVMWNGSTLY